MNIFTEDDMGYVLLPYEYADIMEKTLKLYPVDTPNTATESKRTYSFFFSDEATLAEFTCAMEAARADSVPERFAMYGADYFETCALIVIYTDERSGSNKLELTGSSVTDNVLNINLKRKRGLTMDMSLRMLFVEAKKENVGNATKVLTFITEDASSGGSLF